MMLGWSVTTRSIQVGFLCGSKFGGSEISWDTPSLVVSSSISIPLGVVSPSLHQNCACALKSPVTNTAEGFAGLIL